MERILVPLDGSPLSESILPVAEVLARDYGAELLLIRAVLPRGADPLEPDVELAPGAEAYLLRKVKELNARGLARVRWSVWHGRPEQAIGQAAVQSRVDLITMTTHGRGGFGRLLLGSVAESVVRSSPAPVLLVRGEPSWIRGAISRILVPLDGSQLSEAILPVVERLAGPFDFTIDLLAIVEPMPSAAAAEMTTRLGELIQLQEADCKAYLAKIAEGLEAKGLRVRQAVRVGHPVEVIRAYAEEEGVGLIGMTTHGRSGLGRLFLGSVAERVSRTAPVPVLLWKAREEG